MHHPACVDTVAGAGGAALDEEAAQVRERSMRSAWQGLALGPSVDSPSAGVHFGGVECIHQASVRGSGNVPSR